MDTCAQSNTKAGGSNQNVLAIALISEGTTTVSLDFTTFKYYQLSFTASLSAVFRSQKGTKLLHTSGACPGDGSYYY